MPHLESVVFLMQCTGGLEFPGRRRGGRERSFNVYVLKTWILYVSIQFVVINFRKNVTVWLDVFPYNWQWHSSCCVYMIIFRLLDWNNPSPPGALVRQNQGELCENEIRSIIFDIFYRIEVKQTLWNYVYSGQENYFHVQTIKILMRALFPTFI